MISSFQKRASDWVHKCFGAKIANDPIERNHRFLEEALELVQSCGCSKSDAHALVDYVYSRDIGEPIQELGGVMICIAGLAKIHNLDMFEAGNIELDRVDGKEAKILEKCLGKPRVFLEGAPSPDEVTYAVQHNPNCPSEYLVRLPQGSPLDLAPLSTTKDAWGFGNSFQQAFNAAHLMKKSKK